LEWILIGGVPAGIVVTAVYLAIIQRGLAGISRASGYEARLLGQVSFVVLSAGFVISLTYNSIIWLPVLIATANRRRSLTPRAMRDHA
jgi:hypothetical protein